MTKLERFAIYQLKDIPATREFRFRSYPFIQEKGIRPWCGNYEKVYAGIMRPEDTPEKIREGFNRKLPENFNGHSISISDVLVLREDGNAAAYYVETADFIVIDGFFPKKTSGAKLAYGEQHVQIEGKGGTWYAFDTFVVKKRLFFLMEHEQYGKKAAWIVADEHGKVVVDDAGNGFDQAVRKQLEDYVTRSQRKSEERIRDDTATKNRNWSKKSDKQDAVMKNQNQNKNVKSKRQDTVTKKPQGRPSVLAKLREKQKRIAEDRKKSDLAKEQSTKE